MNTNEKFKVEYYIADTKGDSYEEGIVSGGTGAGWGDSEIPVEGLFPSVKDALKAVCDANLLTFRPDDWECDPCGEDDYGRFCTDFDVNNENCEANDEELAAWREGKKNLWCLNLDVHLAIVTEPRNPTEDEIRNWNK